MNERINQLWTKVCQDEMPELDVTCMTLQRQEKFADLLVQETLQVAKAGIEFGPNMQDAVYTYFGIKNER